MGIQLKLEYVQNTIINKGIETKYDDRIYEGKDIMFKHASLSKFLKENVGNGSYEKQISGMVYSANGGFIKGIISGYFDGDGNKQCDKDHHDIRAASVSERLINDMCVLVNFAGMHAVKGREFQKNQINNRSKGVYHVIHVPPKYAQKFKDEIGLRTKEKADVLDQIIAYNTREDKVSDKEEIDKIAGLGETISQISEKLVMEGHSRLYKRFTKKESIGRRTLGKFIKTFSDEIEVQTMNFSLTGDAYIKANAEELERRRIKQATRKAKQNSLNEKRAKQAEVADDSEDDIIDEPEIKQMAETMIKPVEPVVDKLVKQVKKTLVKGIKTKPLAEQVEPVIEKPKQIIKTLAVQQTIEQSKHMNKTLSKKIVQTTNGTAEVEYEEAKEIPVIKPIQQVKVVDVLKKLNLEDQINIKQKLKILTDAYNSDVVWDEITELEILNDPLEYVYDLTVPGLESFMVDTGILVHNTLNSIDWTEEVIIHDKTTNEYKKYQIGDYIDDLMTNQNTQQLGDNIKDEMGDIYYLDIKNKNHYIESVDENGNISWKLIEAVTKHLPINKDGTNTLLKVTTNTGRVVNATKAKSFLTQINGKIVPIRGDELEIGTCLPIKENDTSLTASLDPIVSIEEVKPTNKYVYDFTVADTKNFMLANGLIQRDSFHHSGVAVMAALTQGVPRIKELLSLTKNLKTPQMIIYPTKEYMGSRDMANKIASYIEYTTIKDIRTKIDVSYDPDPYKKGGSIERDKANKIFTTRDTGRHGCQADVVSLPWLIRIQFDREKMLEKEVTLIEIKSKICNTWEKRHSDKLIKKEEKQIFDNISQIAILSNTDYDATPIMHIRFDMVNFDITILNGFIDLVIDGFKLKGIPSITGITAIQEENTITFDNPDRAIENKKMYVTYTKGSNLYDIRYLNNIDINKTICNDVVAMYETFGIEAARAVLLREVFNAYDRAGSGVNYQHIGILIDMMTFNGTLTSIDRHGMSKTDTGPLSRASFEKTVDILMTAAVFSESDNMSGVSSRIMAGLVIKGGTGYCDVLLDTDMIQNSEFTEDIGQKYVQTYTDISKSNIIEDITGKDMGDDEGQFIPM